MRKIVDNIKNVYQNWKEKHKLSLIHDSTFQEKWSLKLSINSLISLILFFIIFIIVSTFLLIRFTGFKTFIVDDIEVLELKYEIDKNKSTIDSLSKKLTLNDKYLDNLNFILNDQDFDDSIYKEEKKDYLKTMNQTSQKMMLILCCDIKWNNIQMVISQNQKIMIYHFL